MAKIDKLNLKIVVAGTFMLMSLQHRKTARVAQADTQDLWFLKLSLETFPFRLIITVPLDPVLCTLPNSWLKEVNS